MLSSPAIFPSLRRHLRIAFAATFVVEIILLFTSPAQAAPERTTNVQPQLLEWKQEVQCAQTTLTSSYGYNSAPKTLHAAFHKGGVIWGKRYTTSWGSWVCADWDVAKGLHKRTLRALQSSIILHNSGKTIPTGHWDQINGMMRDFHTQNAAYTKLFQQRIDYDVKQALELDFKHDHELAKRVAAAAGNKTLAAFHQSMMDHYAENAEAWRKHGAQASKQIRDIRYGKTATASLATR